MEKHVLDNSNSALIEAAGTKARNLMACSMCDSSAVSNQPVNQKQFVIGTYTGQLAHGKACGKGLMIFSNGDRYEGDWKDNKLAGRGVYTWAADTSRYDGHYQEGKKIGRGVFTFAAMMASGEMTR
eukprot:gene27123-35844_t